MQVRVAAAAWAEVEGRGQRRRVRTALVGPVAVGDWLLIHLDSAVQALTVERAREVDQALDLLDAALHPGRDSAEAEPLPKDFDFPLPSALSAADVARLVGQG